jgi:uncharacterized protein (TIGR01777 family)
MACLPEFVKPGSSGATDGDRSGRPPGERDANADRAGFSGREARRRLDPRGKPDTSAGEFCTLALFAEILPPMRVFITGGTGLIGRRLAEALLQRGDRPVVLSRQADKARLRFQQQPALRDAEVVQGDPAVVGGWEHAVDGCDAVVNLAGHNLYAERWSDDVRRKIRDSRVYSTENVVAAMARASRRPGVLVSGSAIGYYGPRGDEDLTEDSPPGNDFMAGVCKEWEAAAKPAEALGSRVVLVRTGIVLSTQGGALRVMVPVFKWLPGGAAPVGSEGKLRPARGRQWMSWIHLADIVGILLLALDNPGATGPINGTAPEPVRNADFSRALARALRRPFLPIGPPDALLQLALGNVAEIVTTGQKVLPRRARELGYTFRFPDLPGALADLFGKKPSQAQQPATTGGG